MSSSLVESSISAPAADPYKHRRPPYAEEAEQAVIAAMLLDSDAILRAAEHVDDTMFYREAHRRIFRAMVALTERGTVVDPLTLADELARRGELEASGGKDYVAFLVDAVPTAANVEYHAKIVKEKALLRRLIEVSTQIVTEAFEGRADAAELVDQAESRIFQIGESQGTQGFTRIKELLWPAMERIEQVSRDGRSITGVPTGFRDLDEMTTGFQPGDLVIVAARPSMGKCLAEDAELVLADGRVVTIADIYRARDAELLTLGQDRRLRTTRPSAFVDDGIKPTFRVTTALGRTVETTITHPYLTPDGWRPLAEIGVGTRVAVPRSIPVFGDRTLRECEVRLLGYLLGDGGLTDGSPTFTNTNARLRADFAECTTQFGGVVSRRETSPGRAPSLRVTRDGELASSARTAFGGRLVQLLGDRGMSRSALASSIGVSPASVTHWSRGVTLPRAGAFGAIATALGCGVETLLPEGHAQVDRHAPNPMTAWLDALGLWGRGAHDKFIPEPVFTLPRPQLATFLNRLFATDGWASVLASGQPQVGFATVSERLARQVQHLLLRFGIVASLRRRKVRFGGGLRQAWQLNVTEHASLAAFVREIGMFGKEEAVARVAAALEARTPRPRPSEGDIIWDEVVSIEFTGERQVYDLTIPVTHNFVANDVCVHNTAFTLNIAQHAAIEHNIPVAFFSLEMSKDSLVTRMLTSEARIDAQTLRKGRLRDDDFPRLARAAGILSHAPVYIDDTPGISVLEMRAKARRLKSEVGVGLVIVDYLQLMTAPGASENRQQEVSQISRGLKALAKELSAPVVALSQLSRAVEQRSGSEKGRPVLSDLRESGAIEQDADLIMFLFREEVYAERENGVLKDPGVEGKAEVIIGKQRNGPIGSVNLFFHKQYTRFENLTQRAYQGE